MSTQNTPRCTAFVRQQRVATGSYPEVATVLAGLDLPMGSFLVFDDATGTQVDYPWPLGYAPEQPAQAETDDEPPTAPRSVAQSWAWSRGRSLCCLAIGRGWASNAVALQRPYAGWWMRRAPPAPPVINCARPKRPATVS